MIYITASERRKSQVYFFITLMPHYLWNLVRPVAEPRFYTPT